MAHFEKDFISFFKELKENNSKDWFDENRKRYEKNVKNPFKAFAQLLIDRLSQEDPNLLIEPKNAIFRINRDIRFSKDKTPYKGHASMALSKGGKKNYAYPGIYLEFNTDVLKIYGGVFGLDKDQLNAIRQEILYNPSDFKEAINDKQFIKHFEGISGEQNKRIPKEYVEIQEDIPEIANKQFYYFAKLPIKTILKDDLIDIILKYYNAGKPVREFLKRNIED